MSTSDQNKRLAEHVEGERADARDAEPAPNGQHYVVVDDGELVEVKTTKREVGESYRRTGRYQLEESNHEALVDDGGTYDFVLRDDDGLTVEVETMDAGDVDELLRENGRTWPNGSKLKVRWDVIHE